MENQKQTAGSEFDGKFTIGRLGRMCVFFLTAGFMYPNVFVEGINPTLIQSETQGNLYNKK